MVLLSFGSSPEHDEDPLFGKWWASLPAEFKIAKGAARRQWKKLKPSPAFTEQLIAAVQRQSQTEKWRSGYRTTPERWLRDERWEDYVEPGISAWEPCTHRPPCPNPSWCLVVRSRERGEVV